MAAQLLWAAENNALWCDVVCRTHGIPTAIDSGLWAAKRRSPELYPDAVTLRPGLAAEDVLRDVDGGPGSSVKDSFADLDLAPVGFRELFRAQWIFREPAGSGSGGPLDWTVVETAEAFDEWTDAAGLAGILRSELLHDPSVRVLAAYGRDGLRAGAVANRTGSVVGVSNVFVTSVPEDDAWASLAAALAVLFPSLPLVGYERGQDLEAAVASGFSELGPLRVWLRAGP